MGGGGQGKHEKDTAEQGEQALDRGHGRLRSVDGLSLRVYGDWRLSGADDYRLWITGGDPGVWVSGESPTICGNGVRKSFGCWSACWRVCHQECEGVAHEHRYSEDRR